MTITGPFSERWARSKRRGEPTVYQYDQLPREFRVQVSTILLETLGDFRTIDSLYGRVPGNELSISDAVWNRVHRKLAFNRGVFRLTEQALGEQDMVIEDLQSADTLPTLDAIELVFADIDGPKLRNLDNETRQRNAMNATPDEAMEQLNWAFRRHDLGYYFVGGMIVRVDNTFMHAEVVEPAITLLHEEGFKGASDEFLSAHKHYRRGEYKDAITDANNAFESTLKTVCQKRDIPLTGREAAGKLVDKLVGSIIPPYLKGQLEGLDKVMKGLPTLRNNTGGAAHGQGEAPQDVLDHAAAYALHMCAANIVFVVEAWKATEAMEAMEAPF